MECPYCSSNKYVEVKEYPYPYIREQRKTMGVPSEYQYIRKYQCKCGYAFFYEERKFGTNPMLFQQYKQGMYQYKG